MLVGQERAEAILSRALRQGRVSHAYLFVGPEAVGKNTAALLFAQALNCERGGDGGARPAKDEHEHERENENDRAPGPARARARPLSSPSPLAPCGTCDSCRRIAAGTHPDVHVIVPGSKGGQNISVEQMRGVRQDVARRPIMGRRKLYLVPTAEAMNEEAANTLLKTLEEPPEYVTLVLMATSPTRVLPTVLSRCQVVPFGLAPAAAIRDWLQANGVAAEAAAALAFSATGRPGLALRWSQEPEALERRRQALRLLEETARLRQRARQNPGESIAALRLAERARALVGSEESDGAPGAGPALRTPARPTAARVPAPRARGREKPEPGNTRMTESPTAEEGEPAAKTAAKPEFMRLLELIRGYYRDLLLLAQGAPEALIRNADQLSALRAALGARGPAPCCAPPPVGELLAALEAVNRCQQFLERNVAPQLALETLFLDLLLPAFGPTKDEEENEEENE